MKLANDMMIGNGLVGGVIIGTTAAVFMLLTGKVTGLSGIVKGTVSGEGESWQYTYALGLISAGLVSDYLNLLSHKPLSSNDTIIVSILAGLLVGYGSKMSGGCTSGHGLCGMGRLSPRSFASVCTFLTSGSIAAISVRQSFIQEFIHTYDLPIQQLIPNPTLITVIAPTVAVYLLASIINRTTTKPSKAAAPVKSESRSAWWLSHGIALGCSFMFGMGLVVGQMYQTKRTQGFLDFLHPQRGWDLTLAAVLASGASITMGSFLFFKNQEFVTATECQPVKHALVIGAMGRNLVIDEDLILGSIMFGLGWGLVGFCPGPAMVNLGGGNMLAGVMVPAMLVGFML